MYLGASMKRILLMALTALAFSASAGGNGPGAVRKQVEASLLVTGMITIEPDGSVSAVDLDKPEKLPEGIAAFVGRSMVDWRFEPVLVDGKPSRIRTKMSARLVGKRADNGRMRVTIRGADFGDYEAGPEAERITQRQLTPPQFPEDAAYAGAQGTVYLLLKIGRDGAVEEVATEQVNLRIVGSEYQMKQLRNVFARSATVAARNWTFNLPAQGEQAGWPYWSVRVPIDFNFYGDKPREYGQWEAYVPGPRQRVAWAQEGDSAFTPDALPDGGIYLAGSKGPKLLTALTDG